MIKVMCKWTNFLFNITLLILLDKMDHVWVAVLFIILNQSEASEPLKHYSLLSLLDSVLLPKLLNLIFCNISYFVYYISVTSNYLCIGFIAFLFFVCLFCFKLSDLFFFFFLFHTFFFLLVRHVLDLFNAICFVFSFFSFVLAVRVMDLFHAFSFVFVLAVQTCFGFGFMHFYFLIC